MHLRIARNPTQNYPIETTQLWSVRFPYWTDDLVMSEKVCKILLVLALMLGVPQA